MFIKNWVFFFLFFNSYSTRLHVGTVATKRKTGLMYLEKSCAALHLNLNILGMGQDYPGNYMKIIWAKELIASLPKNDILLFVDGYDVLILASEEEIITKFKNMKASFIIGAEPVLSPYKLSLLNNYPDSPTRFRFINAGCYIGYVDAIEKILDDILSYQFNYKSDQRRTHEHFLKNKSKYVLDSYCDLFLNLSRVPLKHLQINYEKRRIFHKPTQTMPIAIHGCGLRKQFIKNVGKQFFRC